MSYKIGDEVIIKQVLHGGKIPAGIKCRIISIEGADCKQPEDVDYILQPIDTAEHRRYSGKWYYGISEFVPAKRAFDALKELMRNAGAEIK